MRNVLEFLGLDTIDNPIPPPSLAPTADELSEEWVQRFREECQNGWENRGWQEIGNHFIQKENHMQPNLRSDVVRSIRRRLDPDEYRAIRKLWIAHSAAEDAHDIPGLMATLTEDCVYTVVNTGTTWHGKPGATQFYQQLLTAFPDVHFDLQNIVIGPQGVFEEAFATGTYQAQWLDLPSPNAQRIEFSVTIQFPWDPNQYLFSGERIYFFMK